MNEKVHIEHPKNPRRVNPKGKKVDLTPDAPSTIQLDSSEYSWHDEYDPELDGPLWAGHEDGYAKLIHELDQYTDNMDPVVSARIAFDRVDEIITEEQVQLRRAIVNHFSKPSKHSILSAPAVASFKSVHEIGPDLSSIGSGLNELTQEFNPIAEIEAAEDNGNPKSS